MQIEMVTQSPIDFLSKCCTLQRVCFRSAVDIHTPAGRRKRRRTLVADLLRNWRYRTAAGEIMTPIVGEDDPVHDFAM